MDQLDKTKHRKSGFSYPFGIWRFGIGVIRVLAIQISWLNNSMQHLAAAVYMPRVKDFIGIAYIYGRTIAQVVIIYMNAAAPIPIRLPEQTYNISIVLVCFQIAIKIFNGILIRRSIVVF